MKKNYVKPVISNGVMYPGIPTIAAVSVVATAVGAAAGALAAGVAVAVGKVSLVNHHNIMRKDQHL